MLSYISPSHIKRLSPPKSTRWHPFVQIVAYNMWHTCWTTLTMQMNPNVPFSSPLERLSCKNVQLQRVKRRLKFGCTLLMINIMSYHCIDFIWTCVTLKHHCQLHVALLESEWQNNWDFHYWHFKQCSSKEWSWKTLSFKCRCSTFYCFVIRVLIKASGMRNWSSWYEGFSLNYR